MRSRTQPDQEMTMHTELRNFAGEVLRAVAIALVPVVVTAFVSMPMNLGAHPGEAPALQASPPRHLT